MRLMLRCDACSRSTVEDPRLFAARHNLDLLTPMLTVSKRLRSLGYPGMAAFDVYGPGTLPAANAP